MPLRQSVRSAVWFFLSLLTFTLSGCLDYAIPLPHGYSLIRANADEIFIAEPSRKIVIWPLVTGYVVLDDIVVGTADWKPSSSETLEPASPRFFGLNTRTGEVSIGSDRAAWAAVLNGRPPPRDTELQRPTWLRSLLR
jgi:hypothetical protein